MKISFDYVDDGMRHRFYIGCNAESVSDINIQGITQYQCGVCGKVYPRVLDIDPKQIWWIDPKTKNYWHESVGIFLFNKPEELLFFERTIYPHALTVPAGHLDVGETHAFAAARELQEETGLTNLPLHLFKDEDISPDPCQRGCDHHKWHIYVGMYNEEENKNIKIDISEGTNPVWLTIDKALTKKLTLPVEYILKKYGKELKIFLT